MTNCLIYAYADEIMFSVRIKMMWRSENSIVWKGVGHYILSLSDENKRIVVA